MKIQEPELVIFSSCETMMEYFEHPRKIVKNLSGKMEFMINVDSK